MKTEDRRWKMARKVGRVTPCAPVILRSEAADVAPWARQYPHFHEPSALPQGFGLRQSSGAFARALVFNSGRGLPQLVRKVGRVTPCAPLAWVLASQCVGGGQRTASPTWCSRNIYCRASIAPWARQYPHFHEPSALPQGFGLRQSPGAFTHALVFNSGRGLPQMARKVGRVTPCAPLAWVLASQCVGGGQRTARPTWCSRDTAPTSDVGVRGEGVRRTVEGEFYDF
jgi:hypothetical protein